MLAQFDAQQRFHPTAQQLRPPSMPARLELLLPSTTPVAAPAPPVSPRASRSRAWQIALPLTIWVMGWLVYRLLWQPAWPRALPGLLQELMVLAELAAMITLMTFWAFLTWRWWGGYQSALGRKGPPLTAKSIDDMYALSPKEFEAYVGRLFQRRGYRVRLRGRSGDHGVDVEVIHPDSRRAVVQCKRYQNTVGEDVVRELFGTMMHEDAAHGFLATTADISQAARAWATGKPITLLDGGLLAEIAAALAD